MNNQTNIPDNSSDNEYEPYDLIQHIEKTRKFKTGYIVHYGWWSNDGGQTKTPMKWSTNYDGDYIGDPREAYFLCTTKGIKPEVIEGNTVCSIGFCEKEQKWYGWSHRAIFGFGIGYVADENSVVTISGWVDEYLEEHPELDTRIPVGFEVKDLEDAKKCAIAFADAVG